MTTRNCVILSEAKDLYISFASGAEIAVLPFASLHSLIFCEKTFYTIQPNPGTGFGCIVFIR